MADKEEEKEEVNPIYDIIDYLVRCAKNSFKNAHVDETPIKTSEKIKFGYDLFNKSPTDFLLQFGSYLTPSHIKYFENLNVYDSELEVCIKNLKTYHSEDKKNKRIRNRRYKALQKLTTETDYFSDKQMMYRNPLLYEKLVGQYLTSDEIRERDGVDRDNLTFLNLILETVDRNQMRETKNEQMLSESLESATIGDVKSSNCQVPNKKQWGEFDSQPKKNWGDFDVPDTRPDHKPEIRQQSTILGPERRLLREEFLQEMYSSFLEGKDVEIDYISIDNDEQYDDLQQLSQDAEDQYFDSETNEIENLEEHMNLVEKYGKQHGVESTEDDPLDVFMEHISNKKN